MKDTRIRPQEIDGYDQAEPPDAFEPDAGRTERMEAALEQLRIEHLPFRRAAPEALRELEGLRMLAEEQVTSDPRLADYYAEAWTMAKTETSVPKMALRRVALLQLQLMERAFYLLQLQRYANAPENAGWIELFRRWGASPRFNEVFDEVGGTLTPDFRTFYVTYLRLNPPQPSATRPFIHHPWLAQPDARGRGVFMDSGLVEAKLEFTMTPGAGGEIRFERPSSTPTRGTRSRRTMPAEPGMRRRKARTSSGMEEDVPNNGVPPPILASR